MVHGNGPNFAILVRHSWPFQEGSTVVLAFSIHIPHFNFKATMKVCLCKTMFWSQQDFDLWVKILQRYIDPLMIFDSCYLKVDDKVVFVFYIYLIRHIIIFISYKDFFICIMPLCCTTYTWNWGSKYYTIFQPPSPPHTHSRSNYHMFFAMEHTTKNDWKWGGTTNVFILRVPPMLTGTREVKIS